MNMLIDIIKEKEHNIGSLCLFINKRKKLLDELNNNINIKDNLTLPQKIYIYRNNYNNIYCGCGKIKKWKSYKDGWRETCGKKECIVEKRKKTNLIKYNVDNPLKSEYIRNKLKNTMLEKYGKEYPIQVEVFNNKMKNTMMDRYNVEYPLKSEKIKNKVIEKWNNKDNKEKEKLRKKKKESWNNKDNKEKSKIDKKRKETNLERYGVEYSINNKDIKNKIKKILKDKYNVINTPFENKEIRKKASETYKNNRINILKDKLIDKKCDYISHENINNGINYILKCKRKNKTFKISYTNLRLRLIADLEISPYFYKKHGISELENNFYNFIKDNYNDKIIKNSKNIINPYELDIYLPELKLAFEFNGLYWHSELYKDNNYHLEKTELCDKNYIQLIHIYEDDWIYKQDIVKSMILNKLGKTTNKIYARKTEIKEITDNKLVRYFLEKNHIQGFVGSSIKIGLFYEKQLVSLMTFGKKRVALGNKSENNEYELLRFCNKLNTNVIGGASKLFKYFVNNYDYDDIITYADRSYSNGNLYNKLGFIYKGKTDINYYYIIDGVRHYRFNFRKDKLVKEGYDPKLTEHEIMLERKIYRIYNSGNLIFDF